VATVEITPVCNHYVWVTWGYYTDFATAGRF